MDGDERMTCPFAARIPEVSRPVRFGDESVIDEPAIADDFAIRLRLGFDLDRNMWRPQRGLESWPGNQDFGGGIDDMFAGQTIALDGQFIAPGAVTAAARRFGRVLAEFGDHSIDFLRRGGLPHGVVVLKDPRPAQRLPEFAILECGQRIGCVDMREAEPDVTLNATTTGNQLCCRRDRANALVLLNWLTAASDIPIN